MSRTPARKIAALVLAASAALGIAAASAQAASTAPQVRAHHVLADGGMKYHD
jgi:hypothetical protein